jgi:hypothetical protein
MSTKVDFDGFGTGAILILFLIFWLQSGWYRLDCALGVQKACDLIADEYAKKPRP